MRYGTRPDDLHQLAGPVQTTIDKDNAAATHISGLEADTEYFYQVVASLDAGKDPRRGGSFKTLPDSEDLKDAEVNPNGD